jgi:glucosamine-6-phosphate deaminase
VSTSTEYLPAVQTHPSAEALGQAAARAAAEVLRDRLAEPGEVRLMLAAAPSQQHTLAALAAEHGIDWHRVVAFHMDDYLGLPGDAPQGFGNWLDRHFVAHVDGLRFERIRQSADPEGEADRYERLMGDEPFDLVLLGLGVNGHLAFNDPPARLDDARGVRVVDLDPVSRRQQVDEGHFAVLDDVPPRALSVTIPRLLNAHVIIASVPGAQKRQAVSDALAQPISGEHPGTALRTHPDVSLFLDEQSTPARG